jgi:glycosyltransferase involved in cell wall biosynthesis
MHVLLFCEQHPHTLGGAQVSVNLQADFLERAGHVVTFVSPALRTGPVDSERFIDLPSRAIPTVREYTWIWPNTKHLSQIERDLSTRPAVDVVHVQSDFWGAALGYRYARQHNLPIVHTMHHRLDVGVDRSVPFPGLFYTLLGKWQRWSLGGDAIARPRNAFDYLAGYAHHSDVVTAPSEHFARLLTEKDVVSRRHPDIAIVPTGVSDDVLDRVARIPRTRRNVTRVTWVGRFSPEKRLLEFLEGVAECPEPLDVVIVGDGVLASRAKAIAPPNVTFVGAVAYDRAIELIADSDVLVQTSHDFETQGMTVTEAVSMGTHVVLADSAVAEGLPESSVTVTTDLSPTALGEALARAARARATTGNQRDLSNLSAFRQSHRTAQMIDEYRRAIAR